ncbi:hypothetical protein TraAM80_07156 [Trypanosoma rangeli]|uniref:Uncharacterized protein n=1 Tax=Trypanosoma rangeli TaxID=5698 RepID=A0A422N6S8_TRYRA|nr:uncharacterized protein TraAM80_07156 [Trypanosoma rangeli]RNF01187.1 hypothetical protein TraAM80_07156 [Trypanosoma rangeli]|eukprot:RNF01187.1 hypothetical protein TraAM80_07156 [Trypanosoma rangeli]
MVSRSGAAKQSSSMHEQLLQLLQQQVAIEERLKGQRVLMQRITEGFAVLRERATRHAHHGLSLHDLLVLEAYGSIRPCRNAAAPRRKEEEEGEEDDDRNNHDESYSLGSGNPAWQQHHQLHEAKRAYRSFIRARLLDEGCATPDNPVQFHTLTADSFYLLLPHLTELLQEFVRLTPGAAQTEPPDGSISCMCLPQPPSSSLLSLLGLLSFTSVTEECASLARVLRFLELGLKHFSEVLENSHLRPVLVQNLVQLHAGGKNRGHTGEEVAVQLCQRAGVLCEHLRHLTVEDSHNYDDGINELHHHHRDLHWTTLQ